MQLWFRAWSWIGRDWLCLLVLAHRSEGWTDTRWTGRYCSFEVITRRPASSPSESPRSTPAFITVPTPHLNQTGSGMLFRPCMPPSTSRHHTSQCRRQGRGRRLSDMGSLAGHGALA